MPLWPTGSLLRAAACAVGFWSGRRRAIVLLSEFADAVGRPILVFDCPLDIRRVAAESRRLPDADHHNLTRMLVSLNGIYGHGVLQSLQGVTLLPELIPAFLAAVMETMGSHPK